MNLDAATVSLLAALVVTLCSVVFVLNSALRYNDSVGRLWSVAFVAVIFMTVAFVVASVTSGAWWGWVIGNTSFTVAVGLIWSGFRAVREKPRNLWVAFIAGTVVGVATVVDGPAAEALAGAPVLYATTAVLAGLVAVEASLGALRRNSNARIVSVLLLAVGVYQAGRAVTLLVLGGDDPAFRAGFGWVTSSVVLMCGIVVLTISLSLLQADRLGRRGDELDLAFDAEGILGPAHFRAVGETWLRRGVRDDTAFTLVVADLVNLGEVSVAFGRPMGDRTVRAVARLVGSELPPGTLLGQLSASRFAALTHLPDEIAADRVGARIEATVLGAVIDEADRFRAAVQVGVATTRDAGSRFDDLVAAATRPLADPPAPPATPSQLRRGA